MNKLRLSDHLEKLATFKLVADLKSLHKAAESAGLSQPALSRTIKVLEDVLDCQLMIRSARGVFLTEEGEELYRYAEFIAKSLEDFRAGEKILGVSTKPFRLATYDNIACGILSGLGADLSAQFTGISISVMGTNSKILGELIGRKLDCALIAQPRFMPGLVYEKVFRERYGLFVGKTRLEGELGGRNRQLKLDDLKRFKIITMPDAIAGMNKNMDRLLWKNGFGNLLETDSYEVAVRLVIDGHGIGILPFSSAWRWVKDRKIEELAVKEISRSSFGQHDIALCWNTEIRHPELTAFSRLVADAYSRIPVTIVVR